MRNWLRRHGWLAAVAVAYLYAFPYYPKLHSANELPRVYLVQAIVDGHTFAIDRGVARWGTTADVSPSHGHLYSNKAPGSSFAVVPVYAAVRAVAGPPSFATTLWLCRVVTGVIPTLILLGLLAGFLERFAPEPEIRRLVLVAYALGSMAAVYSVTFIAHQPAAVCLAIAWILAWDVADGRRGLAAAAVAGLLVGCAPLVDYQAAFAVPPLLVGAIVKLRHQRPALLPRALAVAGLATLPPIALLLAYHTVCFGGPLHTGYGASTTFAMYHQQGLLGMTHPTMKALVGTTVSPDNGLFVLSPWLLVALPGAVLLWRRDRTTAGVCIAIAIIFELFVWSLTFWRGGWSVGPRYVTEMLPFWLPAVCVALSAWRPRRALLAAAGAAIVVGVVIFALTAVTYPYWPDDLKNPVWEVVLRMVGDGLAAPNVATALGLPAAVGLAIYIALVGGLVAWAIGRAASWRVAALAFAGALVVLLAYRAFPMTRGGGALYQRQVVNIVRAR